MFYIVDALILGTIESLPTPNLPENKINQLYLNVFDH